MHALITSSLFFSCALSLSLPVDTITPQLIKRNPYETVQSNAGGQICESSSREFTDSDIQETASRACHLLHQQNLFDACNECVGVRPELPRLFNGFIADQVGHNLQYLKDQKTHAHPGSNHAEFVSIDHHNDNHYNSDRKHVEEHKTHNSEFTEHGKSSYDQITHTKLKHGDPSHRESKIYVPHHQHGSDGLMFQFPLHGQSVIHDSTRMFEPSTSIIMTQACVVVSIVELTSNGHYSQCKGRPLSSLMPLETHHDSPHHKTSCVQRVC